MIFKLRRRKTRKGSGATVRPTTEIEVTGMRKHRTPMLRERQAMAHKKAGAFPQRPGLAIKRLGVKRFGGSS